jgi:DNA-binding XRE family transcriptional regulator
MVQADFMISEITADQCRAARALLNWTQTDLARHASISAVSIRAFEKGGEMRDSNRKLLRLTLEEGGVAFIPENGGGAGVRLRKARSTDEGIRTDDLNASNDE